MLIFFYKKAEEASHVNCWDPLTRREHSIYYARISIPGISKVDTILFTRLPYFILFYLIPCHLDALKISKSRLGLYNVHKL